MSGILSFNIAIADERQYSQQCAEDAEFEVLTLISNPLNGTIPSEVGLLAQLTGCLQQRPYWVHPSQLGQLTQLTALDLQSNAFMGHPLSAGPTDPTD